MDLKKQVTNLELSKKLKSLGFEQESLFVWYNENENNGLEKKYKVAMLKDIGYSEKLSKQDYSAYTVAELYSLLYSLLYSNGICDMVISEEPNNLANYLAERLCQLKK